MSTELYIPNIIGKKGTEFYKDSETHRRRSEAARRSALAYWSDKRHRKRVSPTAKAVDVFDMEGHYIATFPSGRKAAISLGIPHSEQSINACRRCDPRRKSIHGYMIRDASPVKNDIEPYKKKPKTQPKGYRKNNSYLCKPCEIYFPDGDFIRFDSVKDLAVAIDRTASAASVALNKGTKCNGYRIRFIKNEKP